MIKVVKVEPHGSTAKVTLESDGDGQGLGFAIEALRSTDARHLALVEATKSGVTGNVGISGVGEATYPVNAEGVAIDDNLKQEDGSDYPPAAYERQPAAYRISYNVLAR